MNDHAGAVDPTDSADGPDYRLGFESLREEVTDHRPPVEGSLPAWLSGTLLRNGPGLFEAGDRAYRHWFDGLAMLRRFAVEDGDLRYSNRFLRTEAYAGATGGRVAYDEFGTAAERGPVGRLLAALTPETTDNALVHVARLGGETVAVTETPGGVVVDPETLATRGRLTFEDDLPRGHATAHHRHDPAAGETWGYVTGFGRSSGYHVYRLPDGSTRRERVGVVPVDQPAYLHSFGLTDRYVLLTEPPFVTSTLSMLAGEEPFVERFEWKPQRGTRFHVLDRATGEVVARHRVHPFFTFHHAAVVEDGEDLVVDLVAFDDPRVVRGMYLDRLRSGRQAGAPGGDLVRYRLPLDGGEPDPTGETLARGVALPRVDPSVARPRYVYAQDASGRGYPQGVVRVDRETGAVERWGEDGLYAGEPVVVPGPGDRAVVLVVALAAAAGRSVLVALDPALDERARAPLPHALPFGFHGRFFAD